MAKNKTALIMVDLQNDFCPGGSLAVPDADKVIPIANKLLSCFDLIIATKDWHPDDHVSFAVNHPECNVGQVVNVGSIQQILWPVHCVQRSIGAAFHPDLDVSHIDHLVFKGTDKGVDSYSAFFDNAHLRETGLQAYLHQQAVHDIYIMGLATDYCVKYSCLDAVKLGFNVFVIEDGCRGVELVPGDIATAINEMQAVGVKLVNSSSVVANAVVGKNQ